MKHNIGTESYVGKETGQTFFRGACSCGWRSCVGYRTPAAALESASNRWVVRYDSVDFVVVDGHRPFSEQPAIVARFLTREQCDEHVRQLQSAEVA